MSVPEVPYRPCTIHGGYDPSLKQCPGCLEAKLVEAPRTSEPEKCSKCGAVGGETGELLCKFNGQGKPYCFDNYACSRRQHAEALRKEAGSASPNDSPWPFWGTCADCPRDPRLGELGKQRPWECTNRDRYDHRIPLDGSDEPRDERPWREVVGFGELGDRPAARALVLAKLKEARRRIREIPIKKEHVYALGLAIGVLYQMRDELATKTQVQSEPVACTECPSAGLAHHERTDDVTRSCPVYVKYRSAPRPKEGQLSDGEVIRLNVATGASPGTIRRAFADLVQRTNDASHVHSVGLHPFEAGEGGDPRTEDCVHSPLARCHLCADSPLPSRDASVNYVAPWVVPLVMSAATLAGKALKRVTEDDMRELRRAVDGVPTITPTVQRLRPEPSSLNRTPTREEADGIRLMLMLKAHGLWSAIEAGEPIDEVIERHVRSPTETPEPRPLMVIADLVRSELARYQPRVTPGFIPLSVADTNDLGEAIAKVLVSGSEGA